MSPTEAHRRAYDALAELGRGGHDAAGALLVELVAAQHPGADHAIAEVAAGRWAAAIDVFSALLREGAAKRRSA